MSLKVFTDVNKDSQYTETISTSKVNKLYIKNMGTSLVTLYRIRLFKTDINFRCLLENGVKGSTIGANIEVLPGQVIPLYVEATEQSDVIIKAFSFLDINMEYAWILI